MMASPKECLNVKLVTYNMHGFFQGLTVIEDLISTENPDIILLQEHWLTPDNLNKFEHHFSNYFSVGSSAMAGCLQSGMLKGRPFGGVTTLIKKNLRTYTQIVHCDDRFVVVRFANYLIVNVYLPCSGTKDRESLISDILADVNSWREQFLECEFIMAGDLNINLDACDRVASFVNNFAQSCCLCRCDDIFPDQKVPTYVNIALGQESCIDYILTSCPDNVSDFVVLDPDLNYSDHLPLIARICNISAVNRTNINKYQNLSGEEDHPVKCLRWDKADTAAFYAFTGAQLNPVLCKLDNFLLDYENRVLDVNECCIHIDNIYNEVVTILRSAAEAFVPQRKRNFYKFWWSEELDCLKQASIDSNRLWKAAGKPRHGPIFTNRQSHRMNYRKRLREEQRNETRAYTNELHDALMLKNGPAFWKCWRSKFNIHSRGIDQVDGRCDKTGIAENFASYFNTIYSCNNATQAAKLMEEYNELRDGYSGLPTPCALDFDTELVSSELSKLKRGKAADITDLTAEHLLFSHPILSVVLSRLFRLILLCSYVPNGFKHSYIVPIPKTKEYISKSLSCDDFRGIAISPVISKLFEYCFLDRYRSLLASSGNQFGFKKGSGCSNAIYTLRKVVDSYINNGTTVNICSIDLSKAFDKVNHYALFIKLMKRHFPVQLLNIIVNLFTGCLSCVKWDSTYSNMFAITFGVRQGSVLSPILFSVCMNDLANIDVGVNRICIILYADDILLIAPSITMLEKLLHKCESELQWLDMSINLKKSCCLRIGPRAEFACNNITCTSGVSLTWVNELRYLGVYIVKSRVFKCSFEFAKRCFYRASNAIFGKIGRIASEEVILHIIKCKCLPVLLYGLEVCPMKISDLRSLDFVINRFFMKLFKTNAVDTVKVCQEYFNFELPSVLIEKWKQTFLSRLSQCYLVKIS